MQQSTERKTLLEAIRVRLAESPVVALLGARQVGKTTLAGQVAADWAGPTVVFDLEKSAVREALQATPEKLLAEREGLVIVDEVQRWPKLFELLRPLCDDRQRQAVFLLLGSASWDLVKGVSETLAGRIQFVDVAGFSLSEVGGEQQDRLWLRGGFPRAFLAETIEARERWMESFTRTFLERDIPGLGTQVAPTSLGRFWRMLAHFHGQTWNAAELARSMDVSATAVNHYRDLLAGTFMVRVLPPWFENLGKRLVKSPKVYLRDSGILHHLLGLGEMLELRTHPRYGASWEGFALEQVLIAHGERDAYFYGTQRGAELDLLLLRRGQRWGFEFKCTDAPKTTKSMHVALDDLKLEHLWVVYPGTLRFPMTEKITALPLREIGTLELKAPSGLENIPTNKTFPPLHSDKPRDSDVESTAPGDRKIPS
ncbi:MAG: ATP-binding protein [Opitutus sp.]|nr:ATP-binding protein [Opitutus sp.]